MRVKVCGITNLQDAISAVTYGAWALGFNFYPKSPRMITFNMAKQIIDDLPESIIKVGVVDSGFAEFGLDLSQIYEEFEGMDALKKNMILSLTINHEDELPEPHVLKAYQYILLDAPKVQDGCIGGTGRQSNWCLAKKLAKKYKLILAGGLNVNNIEQAIDIVQPYAVDVASALEKSPGIKDIKLMKQFLEICKNAK